jgi:uncharacterized membrane protein
MDWFARRRATDGSVFGIVRDGQTTQSVLRWRDINSRPAVLLDSELPLSDATIVAVSADGTACVGNVGYGIAWRWDVGSGLAFLEGLPGYDRVTVLGASADLTAVAGSVFADNGLPPRAVAWFSADARPVDLGELNPDNPDGASWDTSRDGSIIVGASGNQAFRWEPEGGMDPLVGMSVARQVSGDGQVVFGLSPKAISVLDVAWSKRRGTVPIDEWLASRGFDIPADWLSDSTWGRTTGVVEVSADQLSLVIMRGFGDYYFYRLPGACPTDLDASSATDFDDLLEVLAGWGSQDGDVTGDQNTDIQDLYAVLEQWGPCA